MILSTNRRSCLCALTMRTSPLEIYIISVQHSRLCREQAIFFCNYEASRQRAAPKSRSPTSPSHLRTAGRTAKCWAKGAMHNCMGLIRKKENTLQKQDRKSFAGRQRPGSWMDSVLRSIEGGINKITETLRFSWGGAKRRRLPLVYFGPFEAFGIFFYLFSSFSAFLFFFFLVVIVWSFAGTFDDGGPSMSLHPTSSNVHKQGPELTRARSDSSAPQPG